MKVYKMIPVFQEMGYATIAASMLSCLLCKENTICTCIEPNPQRLYDKQPPKILLLEVNTAVNQWVVQMLSAPGVQLNSNMICKKPRGFTYLLGYPNNILIFSNRWLKCLKV
jgi:hypothetical protein